MRFECDFVLSHTFVHIYALRKAKPRRRQIALVNSGMIKD